jgi:hypothetical protein
VYYSVERGRRPAEPRGGSKIEPRGGVLITHLSVYICIEAATTVVSVAFHIMVMVDWWNDMTITCGGRRRKPRKVQNYGVADGGNNCRGG